MLGASVTQLDLGAHAGQQLALGFNVAHLGNIFQDDGLIGQQGGGHGGQGGVFGAANAHRPQQRSGAPNYEFIH